MRKIPKLPSSVVEAQRKAQIEKWKAEWPRLMEMAALEAEFVRQKKAVFVLAGFNDDQAFQLVIRK